MEEPGLTASLGNWRTMALYILLVLIYLLILKIMLNLLDQLTRKRHHFHKSIVDSDIRSAMADHRIETGQQAFDAYALAVAIVRFSLVVVGFGGVIIVSVVKIGVVATFIVGAIIIALLWWLNEWSRKKQKASLLTYVDRLLAAGGNVFTVVLMVVGILLASLGLIVLPSE